MDTISWKNEFSVGINEIDNQHKKLLAMINRLIAEQKQLTDPKTIAELLTEMTEYAEEHFRTEEFMMAEHEYKLKSEHELEHQAFIEKTRSFMNAADVGPNILSSALLDYLSSWLVRHILTEDMKYKDFFQSKGIN